MVAHPDDADDGRHEPADGRQEAEGNDRLPVTALADAAESQPIPVEDTATRVADELCCCVLASGADHTWVEKVERLTLTIRPKATNQQMEMTMSTGQCTKAPLKGKSQMSARKMAMPATTSV